MPTRSSSKRKLQRKEQQQLQQQLPVQVKDVSPVTVPTPTPTPPPPVASPAPAPAPAPAPSLSPVPSPQPDAVSPAAPTRDYQSPSPMSSSSEAPSSSPIQSSSPATIKDVPQATPIYEMPKPKHQADTSNIANNITNTNINTSTNANTAKVRELFMAQYFGPVLPPPQRLPLAYSASDTADEVASSNSSTLPPMASSDSNALTKLRRKMSSGIGSIKRRLSHATATVGTVTAPNHERKVSVRTSTIMTTVTTAQPMVIPQPQPQLQPQAQVPQLPPRPMQVAMANVNSSMVEHQFGSASTRSDHYAHVRAYSHARSRSDASYQTNTRARSIMKHDHQNFIPAAKPVPAWVSAAPRIDGKLCVVTGAEQGMGRELARFLAHLGATVVMACKYEEPAIAAKERILIESPDVREEQLVLMELDPSSFKSVRDFVHNLEASGLITQPVNCGHQQVSGSTVAMIPTPAANADMSHIAVTEVGTDGLALAMPMAATVGSSSIGPPRGLYLLVNYASIIGYEMESLGVTSDGLEEHFQYDYLSIFLLTHLLLPHLKQACSAPSCPHIPAASPFTHHMAGAGARIINVSNGLHVLSRQPSFAKVHQRAHLTVKAYARAKACVIAFTRELSRRLISSSHYSASSSAAAVAAAGGGSGNAVDGQVSVFVVNPGPTATEWTTKMWTPIQSLLKAVLKNEEKGVRSTLYLATHQGIEPLSGYYFDGVRVANTHGFARHPENDVELWNKSLSWAKMAPGDIAI
ncbi:NAD(P)-binding protein [Ramicandelaber brevisporus]|nr:NAD(P)-binding protein [Ramicandelaber brevisporus]